MTQTSQSPRVVILGAGVSGLMSGLELAKRGHSVVVLEREASVGGLARSAQRNGCSFDYGPHQLYTGFDAVREQWSDLLGDDLLRREKQARVRFQGRILRYPLSTSDILRNISPLLSARCFAEYAAASARQRLSPRPDRSFEDWVRNRFGKTLYEIHFGPYTEKVWGIPPSQVTAEAAEKRIAVQNLWDLFVKTLSNRPARYGLRTKIHHSPYQNAFHYPRRGIGQLVERIHERFLAAGGLVRTEIDVRGVDLTGKQVSIAPLDGEGQAEVLGYEQLITTIPTDAFAKLCSPALPSGVEFAATSLRFRAMCFLHLIVKKPQVTPAHWIYFPEPHLTFQRSAEYSNFAPDSSAPGRAAFSLEIPCFVGDERWTAPDAKIFRDAMAGMREVGILRESEIEDYFVVRTAHAYPLFSIGSAERAQRVLEHFRREHPDVHFTGRQACFSYVNIDHCMHFAGRTAERVDASITAAGLSQE